jgi:hypothetical protein
MIEFIMALLVFASGGQPSGQSTAAATRCDAIDKIDFNNSELNFESKLLQFRDGKACTKDGEDTGPCDWEHVVTFDKVLTPEPGQAVRLMIINSNHLTGSGAWDHVLLFECKDGRVVSAFNESYLHGVKIEKLASTEFSLISGEWLKNDPECCPSRNKREVFHWDRKKGAFILSEKTIHK